MGAKVLWAFYDDRVSVGGLMTPPLEESRA